VVRVSEEKDAHGVATTTVKIEPETTEPLKAVLLSSDIEGQQVPVVLVSEESFEQVYEGEGDPSSRLGPGRWIRLINAEMITAFLNPLFVVLLTPVVVAFFTWRTRVGKSVSDPPGRSSTAW
jgi:hypothetical protein